MLDTLDNKPTTRRQSETELVFPYHDLQFARRSHSQDVLPSTSTREQVSRQRHQMNKLLMIRCCRSASLLYSVHASGVHGFRHPTTGIQVAKVVDISSIKDQWPDASSHLATICNLSSRAQSIQPSCPSRPRLLQIIGVRMCLAQSPCYRLRSNFYPRCSVRVRRSELRLGFGVERMRKFAKLGLRG